MKTPLLEALSDFSFKLQKLSYTPLKELEVVLPIEQYRQFEYELAEGLCYNIQKEGKYDLYIINGVTFKISCKELNDLLIKKKLDKCFEILNK